MVSEHELEPVQTGGGEVNPGVEPDIVPGGILIVALGALCVFIALVLVAGNGVVQKMSQDLTWERVEALEDPVLTAKRQQEASLLQDYQKAEDGKVHLPIERAKEVLLENPEYIQQAPSAGAAD